MAAAQWRKRLWRQSGSSSSCQIRRPALRVAVRAGVGEDDDGGFEALGAVHGHDADGVAGLLGVALELAGVELQPVEEAFEGGGVAALVGQGLAEEGLDGLGGVGAEAGQEALAAAAGAQDVGVELEGRHEVRTAHPAGQALVDGSVCAAGAGSVS